MTNRVGHIIELSLEIAKKQIKLTNEGSYLGILWYFISPVFMFVLLLFIYVEVFTPILGNTVQYYPLYLLLGLIIYNFFRSVTVEATRLVYDNRFLIKSIKFPYMALVGASIIRIIVNSVIEMAIFSVVMYYYHISLINVLFYPIIFLPFFLFVFGTALFLAAVTIFFLDLQGLWGSFVHVLWFATPIFYLSTERFGLSLFNAVNPLYYYITSARELIIYSTMPSLWMWVGMVGFALCSLTIGAFVFSRLENQFAEKC